MCVINWKRKNFSKKIIVFTDEVSGAWENTPEIHKEDGGTGPGVK